MKTSRSYSILVVIFMTLAVGRAYGQSKSVEELNKEKEKLHAIIEQNRKLMDEYATRRNSEMLKISVVDDQLAKRKSLIQVYNSEIQAYNKQIKQLSLQTDSVENEVRKQKSEYAEMLRHMQANGSGLNTPLAYILSSKSFNQSYKRYLFLKQYSKYRKDQFTRLSESKRVLKDLKDKVSDKVATINDLVKQVKGESAELNKELTARQKEVQKLQQGTTNLQQQIVKAEEQTKKLEAQIVAIIKEEAERARREAEDAKRKKNEVVALSEDIMKNRGRLPWPVKSHVVTSAFGEHDHPLLPQLKIRNNGVDIDILSSDSVHPVHKGKVSRVIVIPGSAASIIVRHGEILTVYSNISEVKVKKDDEVDEKTNLGSVYKGEGINSNILHFEIWKGDEKQNPEDWLRKE